MKHPIAITLGDPGGIGPEVTLKALSQLHPWSFIPVLIGPRSLMNFSTLSEFTTSLPDISVMSSEDFTESTLSKYKDSIIWIDSAQNNADSTAIPISIGQPSKQNGSASLEAITLATSLAMNKHVSAIVTAPISKESLHLAGSTFTGHTTLLSDLTESPQVSMGFYSSILKVILTTIHIPLHQVSTIISTPLVSTTLQNSVIFSKHLGLSSPRIGVAGLNPHAGESGLFGTEEADIIQPAIDKARLDFKDVTFSDPIPPDTLFYRAAKKNEFDMVVAMYHDQGLIPLKLLAFDDAVNISIGLPFIRTSPDHGTAFDISFQNCANPTSMKEAISLAVRLSS